ncbi:MAG: DUF481 domain-containing protein [Nitrospirota bacterium]|nr:DUF481 domain-containing protein [Nitrospirota bacterium]
MLCAVLIWVSPAWAQVNTESLRSTDTGLSGALELSLSNRTGNTDLLTGGAALQLAHNTNTRTLLFAADVTRSERRAEEIANRGFGHARWTHFLSRRVGWELFVQHEYDSFALLDARTLLGTGPRFTLFDRGGEGHSQKAFLGMASMWEGERLDVPPAGPDDPTPEAVRLSSYLSLALAWDKTRLSGTVYAQPRFGEPKDLRLLAETALRVVVAGPVGLKFSLTMRHDSDPPGGVRSTDTTLTNQLSVEF